MKVETEEKILLVTELVRQPLRALSVLMGLTLLYVGLNGTIEYTTEVGLRHFVCGHTSDFLVFAFFLGAALLFLGFFVLTRQTK